MPISKYQFERFQAGNVHCLDIVNGHSVFDFARDPDTINLRRALNFQRCRNRGSGLLGFFPWSE
jgi:hypothetical protein